MRLSYITIIQAHEAKNAEMSVMPVFREGLTDNPTKGIKSPYRQEDIRRIWEGEMSMVFQSAAYPQ